MWMGIIYSHVNLRVPPTMPSFPSKRMAFFGIIPLLLGPYFKGFQGIEGGPALDSYESLCSKSLYVEGKAGIGRKNQAGVGPIH